MAQESVVEKLTVGPSGEAYLHSIRRRGIDADVAYYDPTAPAPPLETSQEPEQPESEQDERTSVPVRTTWGIVTGAILVGIMFVFIRFGGGVSVSMRGDAQNPSRVNNSAGLRAKATQDEPRDLGAILLISDRREALVLLAQSALSRAVTANGLLLQRSWTARDALRRMPTDQQYRGELDDLVLEGERVHFGGRDVSEIVFNGHVDRIRPLFMKPLK